MDWDKLRIFHSVAEAGSFTHAGDTLNLSQSAVSRQISALEDSIGIPLFHRHARGLILTEQGELLYRTAHEVFGKLAMVEAQLTESKGRPQGLLKVTSTVAFGSMWLAPRVKEFLDVYPDIELELILDDKELDLGMREADIAIRLSPPRQADLIQRHLLTMQINVYASAGYLKEYGRPKSLEDLDNHRVLAYGAYGRSPMAGANWLTELGRKASDPRRPAMTINNVYAIMRAVRAGAGIGVLADFLVQDQRELVQLLEDYPGPTCLLRLSRRAEGLPKGRSFPGFSAAQSRGIQVLARRMPVRH